ncbi:hypothetical protein B0T10DRAFT_564559 [Thelonectria olida]|uniref:Uncharacterized protein n=1 Tax=Thelonectria olida TaxID=1576542 RepID=A0A9P8VZ90_9HYPO|nr:hypothetical protein B0T10DRAFT_564559 [Thelonectria olida]
MERNFRLLPNLSREIPPDEPVTNPNVRIRRARGLLVALLHVERVGREASLIQSSQSDIQNPADLTCTRLFWEAVGDVRGSFGDVWGFLKMWAASNDRPEINQLLDAYEDVEGLFELGLATFQTAQSGPVPRDFDSIFALSVLSYATSRYLIKQNRLEKTELLNGCGMWKGALPYSWQRDLFETLWAALWTNLVYSCSNTTKSGLPATSTILDDERDELIRLLSGGYGPRRSHRSELNTFESSFRVLDVSNTADRIDGQFAHQRLQSVSPGSSIDRTFTPDSDVDQPYPRHLSMYTPPRRPSDEHLWATSLFQNINAYLGFHRGMADELAAPAPQARGWLDREWRQRSISRMILNFMRPLAARWSRRPPGLDPQSECDAVIAVATMLMDRNCFESIDKAAEYMLHIVKVVVHEESSLYRTFARVMHEEVTSYKNTLFAMRRSAQRPHTQGPASSR